MSILRELGTPHFDAEGHPRADPATWTVSVAGLVQNPRDFSLDELKSLPNESVDARLTSVSGWSVRATWQGVPYLELARVVRPRDEATHATFGSTGGYESTLSLQNLQRPKVMLCFGVGGEPLEEEYGGPLRLLVPHLWGYKSVKWLSGIELVDEMKGGYWEDRGYTREAEIEAGITFDINTRKKRPIRGGGEVTEF